MSLDSLLISEQNPDFYLNEFRKVLEAHLLTLRASRKTQTVVLSSVQGEVYNGDLYGLLQSLNVPIYAHWITMRANGFKSATDINQDTQSILIPDMSELSLIHQMWKSSISSSI